MPPCPRCNGSPCLPSDCGSQAQTGRSALQNSGGAVCAWTALDFCQWESERQGAALGRFLALSYATFHRPHRHAPPGASLGQQGVNVSGLAVMGSIAHARRVPCEPASAGPGPTGLTSPGPNPPLSPPGRQPQGPAGPGSKPRPKLKRPLGRHRQPQSPAGMAE